MIGIFDSGVGGICAYRQVRLMLPQEDIIYLADRKNAPYGTKTKEEILKFTKNNIELLKNYGARKILIACCTASTLYDLLDREEKEISTPIIAPTAKKVAKIGGKVAVIATEHTARCGAFSREIAKISDASVVEMAEQRLVSIVEGGNRDGALSPEGEEYLSRLAERIERTEANTLILGCTHFSHLEGELKRRLPKINIVSPAREGAKEIVKNILRKSECGKDIYLSP